MEIPYEIKVIGKMEKDNTEETYINIDKIQLTDGENILNFDDYNMKEDACSITISILSLSLIKILENENVSFDDFITYIKSLYKGDDKDGEKANS